MRLFFSALFKLILGIGSVALLLFAPAGTFAFPGAWRLLLLLFIPMTFIGIFFYFFSPQTLSKRLHSKEDRTAQKGVVAFSGILFIISFLLAGFDYRYGWSDMPSWVVWTAGILFIISYGIYAEVMRENEWLSRSIEVTEGQHVVSSGLYGIVRHPMYTATIGMFLFMPLIMGSWWAFLAMIPYIPVIMIRIKDEELFLCEQLNGYLEYQNTVKWRLFPWIW